MESLPRVRPQGPTKSGCLRCGCCAWKERGCLSRTWICSTAPRSWISSHASRSSITLPRAGWDGSKAASPKAPWPIAVSSADHTLPTESMDRDLDGLEQKLIIGGQHIAGRLPGTISHADGNGTVIAVGADHPVG